MTERSVRQFAGSVDAVLSQNFIHHGGNLSQANQTALYQTGNQPDVTSRCTVNFNSAIIVALFISAGF